MIYALIALLCMSFGAISQKKLQLAPMEALPIQYVVSLTLCLLFIPFQHTAILGYWFYCSRTLASNYYFCRGTITTLPTVNCR